MSLPAYFPGTVRQDRCAKQSPVKQENLIKEKLPSNRGLLRRDFDATHLHPPRNDMSQKEAP
jgi:hypothetical protein